MKKKNNLPVYDFGGPDIPPYITTTPNDSRIQAAKDSLALYQLGEKELKRFYNGDIGPSYAKIHNKQELNKFIKNYSGEIPEGFLYSQRDLTLDSKNNVQRISDLYRKTGILPTEAWASVGMLNYRFKKPVQKIELISHTDLPEITINAKKLPTMQVLKYYGRGWTTPTRKDPWGYYYKYTDKDGKQQTVDEEAYQELIKSGNITNPNILHDLPQNQSYKNGGHLPQYDLGSWLGENAMPLLQTAGGAALVATGVGIPAGVGMMAGGVGQMANNALTPDQQMQPQQRATTIANRQYAPTFAMGGPVKNKALVANNIDYTTIPSDFPYDGTSKYKGGYDLQKALEIYTPDETGHLPSVDYRTGEWLKDKDYPTSWKELMASQLSIDLNKQVGSPILNSSGKLQYMKGYALGGPMPQVYEGQNHLGPNGGIPIDGNGNPSVVSKNRPIALVENNEVSWMSPQGTPYIFSDKLGFAKQAKSIMNKYKMRLGENFDKTDSIATTGLNGELANLMNKQEVYKQENGYHTMPDGSTMSDKEMGSYCNGGKLKYGCGGKLPKYALGGPPASIFYMPNDAPIELSDRQDLDLGDASNTQLADFNPNNYRGTAPKVLNTYEPYYGIQQTLGRNSNIEKMAPIVPSVSGAALPQSLSSVPQTPVVPSDFTNTVAGNLNPTKTNSPFDMSTMDYLGYGLQAVSPLANMAMTLANKPKEIKPSYVAPETINLESQRDALRRDATTAANVNRRNARGGSFYNYYSNALAGTNAAQRGLGEGLSQSYLNEAGTNLQSRERAKLTNLEQDRYFENLNSQEQGAYLSNLAGSVSQVGQFGAGFMRDRNQMKSTKMAADAMGTTSYKYDTDPSDGQYKPYVIYNGKKTFIQ